jgi:hypothetical protein
MSTVAASFTAVGAGAVLDVAHNKEFRYSVSGTFVGTVVLEKSTTGGQTWSRVLSATAAASGTILSEFRQNGRTWYRFRCTAYTSGTIVTSVKNAPEGVDIEMAHRPKVGATAGWAVNAANNLGTLATMAAGGTASTLVVPLDGLVVGDLIEAFHLLGQIDSAGNAATLDCQLRKLSATAAGVVDSLIEAATQISVTADTAVTETNSEQVLTVPETVAENSTYYLLVTGTTAAATTVTLQAAHVRYVRD